MVANNLLWQGRSSRNTFPAVTASGHGSPSIGFPTTSRGCWDLRPRSSHRSLGKLSLEPIPASHGGSARVGGQAARSSWKENEAHSAQPSSQRLLLLGHRGSNWLCLWGTPKAVASRESHPDGDAKPQNPLGREGGCKMSAPGCRRLFPGNPHHRTQEGITVAEEGFKIWYFGAKLHPLSASSHTEGR